jgi:hypothetical protein
MLRFRLEEDVHIGNERAEIETRGHSEEVFESLKVIVRVCNEDPWAQATLILAFPREGIDV